MAAICQAAVGEQHRYFGGLLTMPANSIDPNIFASLASAYVGGIEKPTPETAGFVPRVNARGDNLEYVDWSRVALPPDAVPAGKAYLQNLLGTQPIGITLEESIEAHGAVEGLIADTVPDYVEKRLARAATNDLAISQALATGKPVYVPAGDWYISASINLGPRGKLRGFGWQKTALHMLTAGVDGIYSDAPIGVQVKHLAITGPDYVSGNGCGVRFGSAASLALHSEIEDVSVGNFRDAGIRVQRGVNNVVSWCRVSFCGAVGIDITGTGNEAWNNFTRVDDCWSWNAPICLRLLGGSEVRVNRAYLFNDPGYALGQHLVEARNIYRAKFDHCHFEPQVTIGSAAVLVASDTGVTLPSGWCKFLDCLWQASISGEYTALQLGEGGGRVVPGTLVADCVFPKFLVENHIELLNESDTVVTRSGVFDFSNYALPLAPLRVANPNAEANNSRIDPPETQVDFRKSASTAQFNSVSTSGTTTVGDVRQVQSASNRTLVERTITQEIDCAGLARGEWRLAIPDECQILWCTSEVTEALTGTDLASYSVGTDEYATSTVATKALGVSAGVTLGERTDLTSGDGTLKRYNGAHVTVTPLNSGGLDTGEGFTAGKVHVTIFYRTSEDTVFNFIQHSGIGAQVPRTIGTPAAWWRYEQNTVIGSGVSQLEDCTGNGNHLVQATDANRPTIETKFGRSLIRLVNNTPTYQKMTGPGLALGSAFCVWWIGSAKLTASGNTRGGIGGISPTTSPKFRFYHLYHFGYGYYGTDDSATDWLVSGSTEALDDALHLWVYNITVGQPPAVYVDDVPVAGITGNVAAISAQAAISLGELSTARVADWYFAEGGVYNNTLSAAQRGQLLGWFTRRYR